MGQKGRGLKYMKNQTRSINHEDFFNKQTSGEKIKFMLQYGVLAPSTHNSQPWLFKIEENSCKIFVNKEKIIKEADPLGRDLYISFGCLLSNLEISARYFNVFNSIEYSHNSDYVAKINFKNLSERTEVNEALKSLIDAILTRVNTRGIFEKKDLPQEIISDIKKENNFEDITIHTIEDKEKIKQLATLTGEGLKMAYKSKLFRKEMFNWMNNSFSKKKEGIPGYSLRMPSLISLIFPWLVRFLNIGKKVAVLNIMSISSAPLVTVVTAKDSTKETWLNIGRFFEKTTLTLNSKNIKTSIFVASVEMGELYKKVQEIIESDEIPQFLFIAGYMNFNQKPNLRHSVEVKLIN